MCCLLLAQEEIAADRKSQLYQLTISKAKNLFQISNVGIEDIYIGHFFHKPKDCIGQVSVVLVYFGTLLKNVEQ